MAVMSPNEEGSPRRALGAGGWVVRAAAYIPNRESGFPRAREVKYIYPVEPMAIACSHRVGAKPNNQVEATSFSVASLTLTTACHQCQTIKGRQCFARSCLNCCSSRGQLPTICTDARLTLSGRGSPLTSEGLPRAREMRTEFVQ